MRHHRHQGAVVSAAHRHRPLAAGLPVGGRTTRERGLLGLAGLSRMRSERLLRGVGLGRVRLGLRVPLLRGVGLGRVGGVAAGVLAVDGLARLGHARLGRVRRLPGRGLGVSLGYGRLLGVPLLRLSRGGGRWCEARLTARRLLLLSRLTLELLLRGLLVGALLVDLGWVGGLPTGRVSVRRLGTRGLAALRLRGVRRLGSGGLRVRLGRVRLLRVRLGLHVPLLRGVGLGRVGGLLARRLRLTGLGGRLGLCGLLALRVLRGRGVRRGLAHALPWLRC
ncbi:hypothetical protein [Nocardiopsis lucentensis]|uniref:hypothetical protein n=1 Tax=Nocardiopsis lucentensis TaxID=53441 RepID=UPI0012689C21|nr:hypothetical protein [Nocardiopsis lucentensis]